MEIVILSIVMVLLVAGTHFSHAKHHGQLEAHYKTKLESMELLHQRIGELTEKNHELLEIVEDRTKDVQHLSDRLEHESEKNKKILSQKKSSEVRLGLISEQVAPFLEGCPYNPAHMHFLGNPLDFIVFDYDAGELILVEVKSGNSKESARQKLIKNMVKSGKVYYEKMRINEKGVKLTREENSV